MTDIDDLPIKVTSDLPAFAKVPRWLAEDPEVSDKAVRLFAILTRWEGLPLGIVPAIGSICERAGWSRSTTKRALRELEQAGGVTTVTRRDDRGQTSNEYVLRYRPPRSTGEPGSTDDLPPRSTGEPPPGPRVDHELRPTGAETNVELRTASDVASDEEETPRHRLPPETVWAPEVLTLTREFARMVQANGHTLPGPLTKAADSWYDAFDKLLRIGPPGEGQGAVDADEIRQTMVWALTVDEFWPANIQSATTFRKRYTTLRAKAIRAKPNGAQLAPRYAEMASRLRDRERDG